MFVVGIDAGSTATKAVLLEDENLIAWSMNPTGWSPRETAKNIFTSLLEKTGVEEGSLAAVVATGYGRMGISFATKTLTEISCHAKGAHYYFPENETIIDIGGQDSKIIQISPKGSVTKFAMNDKCAAGTGRFLQVMATALGMDLADMANITDIEPCKINSMCTVFAESEVISLLANGAAKESIAAGLYYSVAKRIVSMSSGFRINKITFTGGTAKNSGLKQALEKELRHSLVIPQEPQIIGALGAALSFNSL